jgi:DNA-binding response OmpR family regulator
LNCGELGLDDAKCNSHVIDLSRLHVNSGAGISLVDGEPAVRRARQLMLRSQNYEVRSYATCAAMLADARSRDCFCIVVDVHMAEGDGIELLTSMRATGWRGHAILLDGMEPGSVLLRNAERHGDRVLERSIADGPLVAAIAALEWL